MEVSSFAVAVALTAAAGFAALWWLLHSPYRGVGKAFYARGTGRRFLLTGCASGMGRHLTSVLLRLGHRVAATDVNVNGLRELMRTDGWEDLASSNGGALIVLPLDVCSRSQWDEVLREVDAKWGGLDVCMNIAGFLVPAKIQDATAQDIDTHIDVMVKGPIHGTQLCAALMARRGIHGHIINFSSMAAVGPVSGVTLYAAAKFGCRGFSLAANKDLMCSGVAVTCLMPDALQTPMVDKQLNYEGGAYAFSGKILTVLDLERCMLEYILPDRPVEVWLSPRSEVTALGGLGGVLANVIHSSRAVLFAERKMLEAGLAKQREIKQGTKRA
eukprot:Hpha_TRINITY_DN2594_c0_g1::TRINITY_DN2594_c0_g1_i1::g.1299::m.1299